MSRKWRPAEIAGVGSAYPGGAQRLSVANDRLSASASGNGGTRQNHQQVNPVGIVGGGLSGLACAFALKQRGIPAVVFDTGKHGPGGRASSRILQGQGGAKHVVDHAVQAFTATSPEVRQLIEKMEFDGVARQWKGKVGTIGSDGEFRPRDDGAEGPLWIGSQEAGTGGLCDWLAKGLQVLKDVWVAKLAYASDGDWALLDRQGRQIGRTPSYSYAVMAHNGKCADRLISTAPLRSAAHAPLKCKFVAKPSASSDRLELSSLWVCILEVPHGVADFDGAFIEGNRVLSWAGNNSSKYPQKPERQSAQAWTLISTPEYGSANKCPQEAIPDNVWWKVSEDMQSAFASLFGKRKASSWNVLHLQLWGAALPLNVCSQHFVHDPEARVGVCGDWLTSPSVEGALFSGLALAEAIERDLQGGLQCTGAERFHAVRDGHAIGNFGDELSTLSTTRAVDAFSARGKSGRKRSAAEGDVQVVNGSASQASQEGEESTIGGRIACAVSGSVATAKAQSVRRSRWGRHKMEVDDTDPTPPIASSSSRSDARVGDVWNFAFGANINPWKLREQRKIIPKEQVAGRLPGWRLTFTHRGGMGNIETWTAKDDGPDAVHGMLLLLSARDFEKLSKMEHEYTTAEVVVQAYDGRSITAYAFVSPPPFRLPVNPPPPERYLNLIREGAVSSGLDPAYSEWLARLQSVKGQRGPEYWNVPGAEQGKRRDKQEPTNGAATNGSHLRLAACRAFAIGGGATVVDIGANLAKCKAQDLAEQLARSAAAGVSHLILTGCSVRGSQDSQRICEEWSGEVGMKMAQQHVGHAAWSECSSSGMVALPLLTFTAGVHPHDVKTCDDKTISTLRQLARHPQCVSIGECGLDYDRMFSPRDVQLKWCKEQVKLAAELGMPLFLHERDRDANKGEPLGSAREMLSILSTAGIEPSRVCIHCYTGAATELQAYVSRGYYIGLTGFAGMRKRGAHIRELLSSGAIPLTQLMIETDCPFMMPDSQYIPAELGLQGRRMEACALPAVCNAIAETLGKTPEEVARATTDNAIRFFSLPQ